MCHFVTNMLGALKIKCLIKMMSLNISKLVLKSSNRGSTALPHAANCPSFTKHQILSGVFDYKNLPFEATLSPTLSKHRFLSDFLIVEACLYE